MIQLPDLGSWAACLGLGAWVGGRAAGAAFFAAPVGGGRALGAPVGFGAAGMGFLAGALEDAEEGIGFFAGALEGAEEGMGFFVGALGAGLVDIVGGSASICDRLACQVCRCFN